LVKDKTDFLNCQDIGQVFLKLKTEGKR